jgi:hypothetical protein
MFLSLRVEDLDKFLNTQLSILEITFSVKFLKSCNESGSTRGTKGLKREEKKIRKLSACTRWTLFRGLGPLTVRPLLKQNKETYAFITQKLFSGYDPEKQCCGSGSESGSGSTGSTCFGLWASWIQIRIR